MWLGNKEGLKIGRSQFYSLLRNPIYCGIIKLKAYQEETEEQIKVITNQLSNNQPERCTG